MSAVDPHLLRRLKALYAAAGVATSTFLPFFVLYLADRGVSAGAIGLTLAASSSLLVVGGPLWGHVADTRLGVVRALALTLAVSAALLALLGLPWPGPLALCLVSVAFGSVSGSSVSLEDSLTLAVLGDEQTSYGSVRLWTSLGWAVFVLVAGAVYQHLGLAWMVPLGVACFAVMLVVLRGIPRAPRTGHRPGHGVREVVDLVRGSQALRTWLVALSLVAVAAQGAAAFLPLALSDAGGGPLLLAVAASVAALVEIPFFGRSARIVARLGLRRTYLMGLGVQLVVVLSWAVATTADQIAVARMFTGVAFALAYPATVVITSRLVPVAMRASGQGLLQVAGGLGPVVGAAAGGFVYETLGPQALFVGAAALMLGGAGLAAVALRPSVVAADSGDGQDINDVPVDGSKK